LVTTISDLYMHTLDRASASACFGAAIEKWQRNYILVLDELTRFYHHDYNTALTKFALTTCTGQEVQARCPG